MSAQLVSPVALDAVMALALRYPVFPCRPMADGVDAKKPRTAHGFKDAARDEIQAYQWWDAQPDSLVGIPTGAASGLFVIDDDTAKKPDAHSSAWLDKNRAMLETTRNVITASGGRHYVFRAPEGVSIKSAAGITVDGKKLHSIDVRGDGGYIIDWSAHGLASSGEIQALPSELAAQLTQRREASSVAPSPMSPMVWNAQRDDVARALTFLDPSGRDDWVKGGMAIHHASNGSDDGFALWHSWSAGELTGAQPASYKDTDDCRAIWNSFKNKAGTPVTLHSLFALAHSKGYSVAPLPPSIVPVGNSIPPPPTFAPGVNAGVRLIDADTIEAEAISWLWTGYLARGKLSILAGEAGTGKSTVAFNLAAIVSTGGQWPDGSPSTASANVLIWSGEDDAADTIIPRLRAVGADMRRVKIVTGGVDTDGNLLPFDPARDVPSLREEMKRVGGAALMIVDPIVSAVAGDMHKANDVRRSLQPLVNLAADFDCAVLGITHFSKGSGGSSPLQRVIGSQAFGALARLVMVCAKDEDGDTRALVRSKSNISRDIGGFNYMIVPINLPNRKDATKQIETTRV